MRFGNKKNRKNHLEDSATFWFSVPTTGNALNQTGLEVKRLAMVSTLTFPFSSFMKRLHLSKFLSYSWQKMSNHNSVQEAKKNYLELQFPKDLFSTLKSDCQIKRRVFLIVELLLCLLLSDFPSDLYVTWVDKWCTSPSAVTSWPGLVPSDLTGQMSPPVPGLVHKLGQRWFKKTPVVR